MKMQIGDIILYESNTFIGKVIRTVTGFPFSHVAMVINGNEDIIEANAFIKSRQVNFNDTDYKRVVVLRLISGMTDVQKNIVTETSSSLLGKGYDYCGVFMLLLKYLFKKDVSTYTTDLHKLWCTELVDYTYDVLGIDLVPTVSTHTVTVEDIASSPKLVVVDTLYSEQINP